MIGRIANTIARYGMFQPGQRAGVAVSGGADSVFLLHALVELAPEWDLKLSVLHLDHQLRGADSRADAAFTRDLARRFGLPFYIESADVARAGGNLEEAAREARLAFFRRFLRGGGLDRVAVGHTRNDQAETVLFRFLRGAGTAGLAGVRPVTAEGIVRPLLDLERWEIEGWLRERGIRWREDDTNASREFARNRIRHDLLPQLAREWNPALVDTLAQTAIWAQDEEAYWEAEAGRLAETHLRLRGDSVLASAPAIAGLPAAAARRLVRLAVERTKGDLRGISFSHISAILDLAKSTEGHGRIQVPGVDVIRSFEWLRFALPGQAEPRDYRLPLRVPGLCELPGGAAILVQVTEVKGETNEFEAVYNGEMAVLDRSRLSGSLEVRNWRPGDQYQPVGHSSEEKIKSLFQQARVPLWERRHWPVVTDESGGIVWSGRFGPAARFAGGTGSREALWIEHVPAADESWNRDSRGGRL